MKRLTLSLVVFTLIALGAPQPLGAQQVTDITQQAQEQASQAPATPTDAAATPETTTPVPQAPAQATAAVVAPAPAGAFDFSGGLIFHPVGFDAGDYFLELNPNATVATKFNAFNGKTIDFSITWDFSAVFFVTSDANSEDEKSYTNDFNIALSSQVLDKLKLSTNGKAKFSNNTNDVGSNEIWLESQPTATYSVLPTTTVSLGYAFFYFLHPDNQLAFSAIDAGGAPQGDSSDVGRSLFTGSSSTGGSGAFAFDPTAPGNAATFNNDHFLYIHELMTGAKHKFTPSTSAEFKYWFGRYISNDDNAEAFENKTGFTFTQNLWTDASISANWTLRVLDYIYAIGDDGIAARRDYRNRISFDVAQKLNDYFSLDLHYRYQKTFSNKSAAESDTGQRHQFWTGASVSF